MDFPNYIAEKANLALHHSDSDYEALPSRFFLKFSAYFGGNTEQSMFRSSLAIKNKKSMKLFIESGFCLSLLSACVLMFTPDSFILFFGFTVLSIYLGVQQGEQSKALSALQTASYLLKNTDLASSAYMLSTESAFVREYFETVLKHRELFAFDHFIALNLAEAEKKAQAEKSNLKAMEMLAALRA